MISLERQETLGDEEADDFLDYLPDRLGLDLQVQFQSIQCCRGKLSLRMILAEM
jgi:hypothetical protein